MSKKKLKKFKKGGHVKQKGRVSSSSTNITEQKRENLIEEIESMENERIAEKETEPDIYMSDKYDHVKRDVKKILLIMFAILIVLFLTYYVSLKTTYLSSLGNWIYKILNIQA
jgi:hypothetical protein